MKNTTIAELVFDLVKSLERNTGKAVIAEDIIQALDSQDIDLGQKVRLGKEVHGTLSNLNNEGRIYRHSRRINPASGAEVYAYRVLVSGEKSIPVVPKGYKERYENLLAEVEVERARKAKQIDWLIKQKDEVQAEAKKLKELVDYYQSAIADLGKLL